MKSINPIPTLLRKILRKFMIDLLQNNNADYRFKLFNKHALEKYVKLYDICSMGRK